MSAWSFSYRSSGDPHQRLSDTSDDETPEPAVTDDDEAQLLNWDISSRHEEVVFKPNPWNIAKINAASRRSSAPSRDESSLKQQSNSLVVVKPHRGTLADGFRKQLERQPQKFRANNNALNPPAFQLRRTNPSQNLIETEASRDAGAVAPDLLPDHSVFSFGTTTGSAAADADAVTPRNTLQERSSARNASHTDATSPVPIPLPTNSASFSPLTPVTTTDAYSAANFLRSPTKSSTHRLLPAQNSRSSPACPPGHGSIVSSSSSAATHDKLRYVNQSSETSALTSAFLNHEIQKPIQFPPAAAVVDPLSTCSVNGARQLPSELTQMPPPPPPSRLSSPIHSNILPDADTSLVPGHAQRTPRGEDEEDEYRRQDATLCHTSTTPHAYHQVGHVHNVRPATESQDPFTPDARACAPAFNGDIITARPRTSLYSPAATATIQGSLQLASSALPAASTSPSSDLDTGPIVKALPNSATIRNTLGPGPHNLVINSGSSSPNSPAGLHRSPLFARRQNSSRRGSSSSPPPSRDGSACLAESHVLDSPVALHALGSRSGDRARREYRAKATDAYASLARLDDPDESWSTLPVRKSAKSTGNKPRAGAIKTSGKFKLPISLRRRGGDENVVGNTGSGATGETKRRVITYLPPPMAASALASSRSGLAPGSRFGGVVASGDEEGTRLSGGGKRKREPHVLGTLPTPGIETRRGHDEDEDDHTTAGIVRSQDRYHTSATARRHWLPSPPTSDPPIRPCERREGEKGDVVVGVDVHEMRKRYPRTRMMMTERKRAAAAVWDLLKLPSCGVIYQDVTGPLQAISLSSDTELPIIQWTPS